MECRSISFSHESNCAESSRGLARDGLKVKAFVTTNVSKAEAIEALALAFEKGGIRIPNDPALIGELQAFEGKALPSRLMRYAAPEFGKES
jgi:hypothetical protein